MRTGEALSREVVGMTMSLGRVALANPYQETSCEPGAIRIRIRGGFIPPIITKRLGVSEIGLHRRFYAPMAEHLAQEGHHVVISGVPASSLPIRDVYAAYDEEGSFDVEIGHSFGGITIYTTLVHGENKPALAISLGSPVHGTPWRRLARWVEEGTGATPALYDEYQESLASESWRVIVLSALGDAIAPPANCKLAGKNGANSSARHPVVDRRMARIGHTELATHPRVLGFLASEVGKLEKRGADHRARQIP